MKKIGWVIGGLIMFLPFIFLVSGSSWLGYFTTDPKLSWLLLIGESLLFGVILIAINRFLTKAAPTLSFPNFKKQVGYAVLWAVIVIGLTVIIGNLPLDFIRHNQTSVKLDQAYQLMNSPLKWVNITVLCVTGPILEELGFRGVLTSYFQKLMGFYPAIILVAICFAIAHGLDFVKMPLLAIDSIGLSLMNRKFADIKTSIMSHIAYNLIATGLNFL
ncbi:CPBP family intramembrane glutamic endopeptidase [Agrilactobacillus composti]|nr:type II CAAX endopeptidase family protein [Agrilactobacillus composti]